MNKKKEKTLKELIKKFDKLRVETEGDWTDADLEEEDRIVETIHMYLRLCSEHEITTLVESTFKKLDEKLDRKVDKLIAIIELLHGKEIRGVLSE